MAQSTDPSNVVEPTLARIAAMIVLVEFAAILICGVLYLIIPTS